MTTEGPVTVIQKRLTEFSASLECVTDDQRVMWLRPDDFLEPFKSESEGSRKTTRTKPKSGGASE